MDRSQLTLNSLYLNALKKGGDKTALVFEGKTMTYRELLRAANRVAHALNNRGVKPNGTVAILMSNCLEYVICDMGLNQAGGVKVPLNDMLGEKEIAHILKDCEARVLIVGENFFEVVQKVKASLPDLETVVGVSPPERCPDGFIPWDEFQAGGPESDVRVQVHPEDRALIVYTGGTTGLPKGVVHSQENAAINAFSHVIELCLQDDERILLTSPLPHSGGMVLLAGLLKNAVHFIEKKFDPEAVLNHFQQNKITFTFMVPTMIYRILDQIQGRAFDFSSLRTVLYGAAPITVARLKQGIETFGNVFTQLYGQTEAPNFITRLRKPDHVIDENNLERLRSCGQAAMMCQVKIVDEEGKEVPRGMEGEIVAKTPYNMLGYYKQPDKTVETLKNGWLHTGDVGVMDEEGYVYLLDRKKDMIISGGMNVYSTEVENVIQKHPDVSQVAVIGVPHPDWGEAVTAVVVSRNEREHLVEELFAYCAEHLSKYKRPKEITFIEALPLTPYGKIDKKALRQPFWSNAERAIN
ncbi:class I adenylate-forming enzyme family protein [Aneurinibacillus tyrosinisolvens]|uniref:class I adenylate-forming enzyme family protein n=1 Tax=Aneurinibacillus tyrosinisolvens TaxID=1443435 RepID=UPI00063FD088|nr:long-chain-fatty-acid--CoA ligase [Aneurinibacillus tyrosinisolvens]